VEESRPSEAFKEIIEWEWPAEVLKDCVEQMILIADFASGLEKSAINAEKQLELLKHYVEVLGARRNEALKLSAEVKLTACLDKVKKIYGAMVLNMKNAERLQKECHKQDKNGNYLKMVIRVKKEFEGYMEENMDNLMKAFPKSMKKQKKGLRQRNAELLEDWNSEKPVQREEVTLCRKRDDFMQAVAARSVVERNAEEVDPQIYIYIYIYNRYIYI
jgi:hypothetical protein